MYRILKNAGKSEKHTIINLTLSGFAAFAVLRKIAFDKDYAGYRN